MCKCDGTNAHVTQFKIILQVLYKQIKMKISCTPSRIIAGFVLCKA